MMIITNINKRKVVKLKELNLLIEVNHRFHPIEEKILNRLQQLQRECELIIKRRIFYSPIVIVTSILTLHHLFFNQILQENYEGEVGKNFAKVQQAIFRIQLAIYSRLRTITLLRYQLTNSVNASLLYSIIIKIKT